MDNLPLRVIRYKCPLCGSDHIREDNARECIAACRAIADGTIAHAEEAADQAEMVATHVGDRVSEDAPAEEPRVDALNCIDEAAEFLARQFVVSDALAMQAVRNIRQAVRVLRLARRLTDGTSGAMAAGPDPVESILRVLP